MIEPYVFNFIDALKETFKTMMNVEVTTEEPEIRRPPYPSFYISGIVGLSGSAQGAITLSFELPVATAIVNAMTGYGTAPKEHDIVDGIGELTNIISGSARRRLSNLKLESSLPSVIMGKGHTVSAQSGVTTYAVQVISVMGQFTMEVCLKEI